MLLLKKPQERGNRGYLALAGAVFSIPSRPGLREIALNSAFAQGVDMRDTATCPNHSARSYRYPRLVA